MKNDVITSPNHYRLNGLDIQVKVVIKSALDTVGHLGFYKGQTIKYILRANKKNGLEDYKKARKYLDWYIQELEGDKDCEGQMIFLEDKMERELTPEEEQEFDELSRKLLRTAPPMTGEELERFGKLSEKKYGTEEEIAEEQRQNRKNFLKLQEKLSKKVAKQL